MPDQQSSQELYRGKLITLRIQTLPQPSGGTSRFEIVEHPDAVAIVALRYNASNGPNAEPLVVLVHQHRPAIGKKTWEIPAGIVEPNEREAPQQTAARELREETGYLANHWQYLIREYTSPGFSTEAITIYLATEVYPDGSAADVPADPTEIAQVRWISLSEALALCHNGEIEDGKTILGLYLIQNMLIGETTSTGEDAMPRDATNLPFPRSAAFRSDHVTQTETNPTNKDLNATLNIENMLLEEFNYASLTAYQAMEDRARVSSLYYLLLGALASGLLAIYQLGSGNNHTSTRPLVVALLILAGVLSITFFEKILRLRQAYRDSLICMNVIKEFYIQQFQRHMPQIEHAFRWRLKTIPPGERIGSVTFIISTLIAFMGSFCFGGAILVALKPDFIVNPGGAGLATYLIPLAIFGIALLIHIWYYRRALSKRKEAEILERQEKKLGVSQSAIEE